MSCSTYILYIYYTYYNIYILYYTYYILYTILYNTIHTTYYNIWYIYIPPALCVSWPPPLESAASPAAAAARPPSPSRRAHGSAPASAPRRHRGNRGETVGKVGKVGKHHGKCPQSLKMFENPSVFALRQFWGDDFHIGLWKLLDSGNGQAKMVTFSSPHPSRLQPSGNGKPSKGPEKRMKPWDLHGDIYREMKGGNHLQQISMVFHPLLSHKTKKNEADKGGLFPRCGNFISF